MFSVKRSDLYSHPVTNLVKLPQINSKSTANKAPKVITNKLQRVMNAAACILTGTRKFDRGLTFFLSEYWCTERIRGFGDWLCATQIYILLTYLLYYQIDSDWCNEMILTEKEHAQPS